MPHIDMLTSLSSIHSYKDHNAS